MTAAVRQHVKHDEPTLITAGIAGFAGFALAAILLVPEHLLGVEVLPETWDAFFDLGMLFAIAVLLVRRPATTRVSISPSFIRGVLLGLVAAALIGASAAIVELWVDGGAAISFAALAILGLTILPLRTFVGRRADGVLFGGTHDPYAVLSALGRRVEAAGPPEEVLDEVISTVAETLGLTSVEIELELMGTPTLVASTGTPGAAVVPFPLVHAGEHLGRLVVGVPRPGSLTAADRRLLQDLGTQIGAVAHTAQLVSELRDANRRMIAARADERRRLRRDLHDGLGPLLAGIGLATQAARNQITADPDSAIELLERATIDTRHATIEVRRLLEDLHPLLLDQVGLIGALQRKLDGLPSAPETTIATVGELDDLPADVELAAFRIVVEAHTNVVRHAGARRCRVEIVRGDDLVIRVMDDGHGLDGADGHGIGLRSMAERAAELGGTCRVRGDTAGGTIVEASLPIAAA